VLILLWAACLQAERVETDAGCIKCHEAQVEDWRESVHAPKGVGCIRCHGPESVDRAKSRPHLNTSGFRRGTRKTNPELCGECHRKEFVAYNTSAHAEDTRDEDGKSKGCTSCHAFHETSVADRRAILKENCAACHKPGSPKLRAGEEYIRFVEGLRPEVLPILRIHQHSAQYARVQAEAMAYNKLDRGPGRPPWLWAVPALPFAAAVVLWIRSAPRKGAS